MEHNFTNLMVSVLNNIADSLNYEVGARYTVINEEIATMQFLMAPSTSKCLRISRKNRRDLHPESRSKLKASPEKGAAARRVEV
jgi:hypothetical protein